MLGRNLSGPIVAKKRSKKDVHTGISKLFLKRSGANFLCGWPLQGILHSYTHGTAFYLHGSVSYTHHLRHKSMSYNFATLHKCCFRRGPAQSWLNSREGGREGGRRIPVSQTYSRFLFASHRLHCSFTHAGKHEDEQTHGPGPAMTSYT